MHKTSRLFFQTKLFSFKEKLYTLKYLYTSNLFLLDLIYFFSYAYKNPFRIAKSSRGEKNVYGETPFSLLYKVGKKIGLSPKMRYLELGCGRGKGVFFIQELFGAHATGIDWVKPFIQRASGIKKLFRSNNVEFLYGDMKKAPFSETDVVYIYSTCLKEEELFPLIKEMQKMKKGSWLISVSINFSNYTNSFTTKHHIQADYPWGKADVFMQKKTI